MTLFGKLLNAAGVIVGDLIEGWATRVPREELVARLHEQSDRIVELEEELDRRAAVEESLRGKIAGHEQNYSVLQEAYYKLEREVAAMYDPPAPNPFDLSSVASCRGVTPPDATSRCIDCGHPWGMCVCDDADIPF